MYQQITPILTLIAAVVVTSGCCVPGDGDGQHSYDLTGAQACERLKAGSGISVTPEAVRFSEASAHCSFDQAYSAAFAAAQTGSTGSSGPFVCPTYLAKVKLACADELYCGRPYEGYSSPAVADTMEGYFLRCMDLEAASVVAFEILERELQAFGAPDDLLVWCRKAAADERRHALAMGKLAGTHPTYQVIDLPNRSAFAIALENARVGMVRETCGAVLAAVQADQAKSPHVRETLRWIAIDEMDHAELSWRVHTFLESKLTAAEQRHVQAAMSIEIESLQDHSRQGDYTSSPSWEHEVGLPRASQSNLLMAALTATVWANPMMLHP